MKIETITVMQRLNLGNYEHLEITANARVEEGDDAMSSLLSLRTFVQTALTTKGVAVETMKEETKVETPPEEVKEEPKKRTRKTKATEETKEEVKEEVPETPKEEKKEEPKTKFVKYDRENATHRSILSSFLNVKYPTWKNPENVEKVKAFTVSLLGADFLDDLGVIVPSFEEKLNEFFSKN